MILGRGMAKHDAAIIAEYHQLLADVGHLTNHCSISSARAVPRVMQERIGKPVLSWQEEDILALYDTSPSQNATSQYNLFLAFLLFRGYFCGSIRLLFSLPLQLSVQFRPVLAPTRTKLSTAFQVMGYRNVSAASKYNNDGVGSDLNLLLWCLAIVQKPLEELTREDFDAFKEEYTRWYTEKRVQKSGRSNHVLFRLEQLLIHLKVIAKKPPTPLDYDPYFADFPESLLKQAILAYLRWGEVKYSAKSRHSERRALACFLHWLVEQYPECDTPASISRSISLAYAKYLDQCHQEGIYSANYRYSLHKSIRLFFDFVIDERVSTAPVRNPFSSKDVPKKPNMVPRYLPDSELKVILNYCETEATLLERTITITLLHTGLRAGELAALKASDLVQIAGVYKLHIHQGKGLKDRVIPLTAKCVEVLEAWKQSGWQRANDFLFTHHGRPWSNGLPAAKIIRDLTKKLGLEGVTPHRFRHTFAVALLNYGVRESALQKLMGHATLGMTLEYARILDETVERSFSEAIEHMQEGAMSWVPNFFAQEDYTLFAEGDSVSWIQLPVGFCRRNPKLHCESDVKCFLCERFCATPKDLPRLKLMYERFTKLGLKLKADIVFSQIQQLQALPEPGAPVLIPTNTILKAPSRAERH